MIKAGAFEVRNSPLDHYSHTIAKLIARSRGVAGFGLSAAATVGSLYTIDCVFKEIGWDPVFVPDRLRSRIRSLVTSLIPNLSSIEMDPIIATDREQKILTDNLKELHKKHLSLKEEERVFITCYESNFLSREELIEMGRGIQTRKTGLEEEKQALLTKMLENLEKGYGKTDDPSQLGLNNNDPSKSKVLEALQDSGQLTEDLFPKTPTEQPIKSKVLEALHESGNLTEDTFPKAPTEQPIKSKDLEALNKSGTITEDPISGNTEEKSQK